MQGASQGLFNVSGELRGHATYLRLDGELDTTTSPFLETWLQGVERNGKNAIVVDLEHVTFIDTSGLYAFLRAAERARRNGRDFSMIKAPAVVRRLIEVSRTTHLLGSDTVSAIVHQRV
jgi:anti-anti-sigma factor